MKRLCINIPSDLIKQIDKIANDKFLSRTALIKVILLDYIIRYDKNK